MKRFVDHARDEMRRASPNDRKKSKRIFILLMMPIIFGQLYASVQIAGIALSLRHHSFSIGLFAISAVGLALVSVLFVWLLRGIWHNDDGTPL